MKQIIALGAAVLALALLGSPALAQGGPSGVMSTGEPITNHMGQNNMTQEQFNQLSEYADRAKRLTKEDKAKGKTLKDLLAEDTANATALVKSMPLSCDVTEAILAAEGPATADGKTVDTKTYEAACANGMGYFLISPEPGKPYGFSCFAADATRAADVAAGRPPGAVCQLPPSANVKTAMATVLSRVGTNCTVRDYKWAGMSSVTNAEFNEVACTDGNGYILKTALPGSMVQPRAITCYNATMQGLPCKLTESGAVTIQTLKDALAQHNVTCNATNVRAGMQEKAPLKRYVAEFQCPQYPKGLVAFIPLNGNTAKFETLDCAAAAKRGVMCKLRAAN